MVNVIWQNPQKIVLVGNHLDTLFLFIASMGDVNRITHNRRKDFSQGSTRQKVDLEEKKIIFSLFQMANQTFGKSNGAKVVYFFFAIYAATS